MRTVGAAWHDIRRKAAKGRDPPVRTGASTLARAGCEGVLKQILKRRWQRTDWEAARRDVHLRPRTIPRVGIPRGGNRIFDGGWLACALEAASKGMAGHAEQLEDDDCKAKVVVVRRPDDSGVAVAPLHLRGLMGAYAHRAKPGLSMRRDLETVAIDHLNGRVVGNHEVAMVDVADDEASGMHGCERPGRVAGCVDQEAPVRLWEGLQPRFRQVELEDRLMPADLGHREASNRTRGIVQGSRGPSGDLEQAGTCHPRHRRQLGRVLLARRL